MKSPFDLEAQYDRLDDQGQFDAAEIREKIGYETDGSNEDFTAAAIAARTGDIALQGALEENTESEIPAFDGTNQKGGLNHGAWGRLSPAEKAQSLRGVTLAKESIRKSKEG